MKWNFKKAALIGLLPLFVGCMTSAREEKLNSEIATLKAKIEKMEKSLQNSGEEAQGDTKRARVDIQNNKGSIEETKQRLSLQDGAINELAVKLNRLQEMVGQMGTGTGGAERDTSSSADAELLMNELQERVTKLELRFAAGGSAGNVKAMKIPSVASLKKTFSKNQRLKKFQKSISYASQVLAQPEVTQQQKEVALYFRAEAYFHSKKFSNSAVDYSEFIESFPESEYLARALVLGGDSFFYIGKKDFAVKYYKQCVNKFPESAEANSSKERIQKIGG